MTLKHPMADLCPNCNGDVDACDTSCFDEDDAYVRRLKAERREERRRWVARLLHIDNGART